MQKILQNVSLGENLQRIRRANGMSQNDVAMKMQLRGRPISRAHYANIEQGVRNLFVTDLVLLHEIFGVSYDEFFRGIQFESCNIGN